MAEIKEIRKFGAVSLVLFFCLAAFALWKEKMAVGSFFSLMALLGLSFTVMPGKMSPVFKVWIKTSHGVGRLITVVILTVAYYLVITPFAVVIRWFSGPILTVKPDPTISSYWLDRSEPAQPKERFTKRY